jgi:hypothetical protein
MQQSISWGSWAAVGAVLSQLACREVPWPPDGEGGAGGEAGEGAGGIGGTLMIDPVLGCSAEAWPARAAIELLPHPDFADSFGWEVARAISADGAVVIGDYRVAELVVLDDIAGRRALQFRSGTWEWVDPAAQGIATVVSCDGGLIAGRLDDYRAFFKTSGEPLVTITPEEPIWSAEPEDSSADGTRIAGNLRYADRMLNRGPTTPAVWTNAGEPTYFESEWPRSLFHVRFDGLLFAGAKQRLLERHVLPGPGGSVPIDRAGQRDGVRRHAVEYCERRLDDVQRLPRRPAVPKRRNRGASVPSTGSIRRAPLPQRLVRRGGVELARHRLARE